VSLAVALSVALAALPVQVSHRGVRTADGVTVGLVRYSLAAPQPNHRRVLIVGELGHGRALWDGFARTLARRGFVVYLAQLRGQGATVVPAWHLRDWVANDLPAVARALEEDGADQVGLIAHGFGGTLALVSAGRELGGMVTRVVALSTPVEAQVSSRLVASYLKDGGKFSGLGTDPGGAALFQLMLGGGPRADPEALQRFRGGGVNDLGYVASAELLEWMQAGDLALADGSTVLGRLKGYGLPTWMVLPLDDGFASSEMAAPLREVSRAPVTMRALSRAEFAGEDYDHASMVLGSRAGADIWRGALRFLEGR
jgi:pimeloyl-ACP methyl ester carboxylesterase